MWIYRYKGRPGILPPSWIRRCNAKPDHQWKNQPRLWLYHEYPRKDVSLANLVPILIDMLEEDFQSQPRLSVMCNSCNWRLGRFLETSWGETSSVSNGEWCCYPGPLIGTCDFWDDMDPHDITDRWPFLAWPLQLGWHAQHVHTTEGWVRAR